MREESIAIHQTQIHVACNQTEHPIDTLPKPGIKAASELNRILVLTQPTR